MTSVQPTIVAEIERYLKTGDSDPYNAAWTGGVLEKAWKADADLRGALVVEVLSRAARTKHRPAMPEVDAVVLARRKVEPMVAGLFPRAEQACVLALLEKSVVFLTDENVERVLRGDDFLSTTWDLANLYLASIGADLLGPDAPRIVGLSVETTCCITPEYFAEQDPFADFLVHEVAHIFHNCKRPTAGLKETRRREWLLDIAFRKRETFAYACEAYARIRERSRSGGERARLAEEYASEPRITEERVEPAELASIVKEACAVRNGWKVILSRCAPPKIQRASGGLSLSGQHPQLLGADSRVRR